MNWYKINLLTAVLAGFDAGVNIGDYPIVAMSVFFGCWSVAIVWGRL